METGSCEGGVEMTQCFGLKFLIESSTQVTYTWVRQAISRGLKPLKIGYRKVCFDLFQVRQTLRQQKTKSYISQHTLRHLFM